MPIEPVEPPEQEEPIDWSEIGRIAAIFGVPLITIVFPVALILGVKIRRRSRRRNHPVVANRLAGAWAEVVDRARDLGRSPSRAATRTEQAEELLGHFEKLGIKVDPVEVSRQADEVVFAPGDPEEAEAAGYWATASQVRRGMRRSVKWPRWLLSWLSTRSFRKFH